MFSPKVAVADEVMCNIARTTANDPRGAPTPATSCPFVEAAVDTGVSEATR
jgi:hypothetical protein